MTLENPGGVRFSGPLRVRRQELNRTGASAADTTVIDSSGTASFKGPLIIGSVDGDVSGALQGMVVSGSQAKTSLVVETSGTATFAGPMVTEVSATAAVAQSRSFVVQTITGNISAASTTAKTMATLPGGVDLLDAWVDVTTGFEASAAAVCQIGDAGVGVTSDLFFTTVTQITAVGRYRMEPSSGGTSLTNIHPEPFRINFGVSAVGTDPDAGVGVVTVLFAKKR